MSDESYVCVIPRNLNKPDLIINTPMKLNWKQVGYLIGGTLASTFIYSSGLPFVVKVSCIIATGVVSLISAFYRYEGSTIDEIVMNTFTYANNKKRYDKIRGGECLVKFNSRKDEESNVFANQSFIHLQNAKI